MINKSKLTKSKLNKSKLNKSKLNKSKLNKHKFNKSKPYRSNIIKPMYGGIMCADITKKYVSYLIHGTSIESFIKILDSNYIKANKGNAEKSFGNTLQSLNKGAFMQLIFDCNKNQIITESEKLINLVMSNDLLSDYEDYHINNNWFGGLKVSPLTSYDKGKYKSYDKASFRTFLEENEDHICYKAFSKNEIIFKENIPLRKYLKQIWICDVPQFKIQKSTKSNNANFEFRRTYEDVKLTYSQKNDIIETIKRLLSSYGITNIPVELIKNIPSPNDDNYCETYKSK